MALRELKTLALEMRLEKQMSYSQIKKLVPVARSTLSVWLRKYPLSEERIRELRDKSEVRIERCRETKRRKRQERFLGYKAEEKLRIGTLTDRDLMMLGLALYWGEGGKVSRGQLSISNTDPGMMKVVVAWLKRVLNVEISQMSVRVQMYKDMDIDQVRSFWSKELKIPLANFSKPHMKKTERSGLTHKGLFGHGTCEIRVYKTEIMERTMASLEVLSGYFD